MKEEGIHIALKAGKVFELWGLPITNTMLMSWIVMIVIGVGAYFIGKNLKKIPTHTQTFFETLFSFLLDYIEEVLESRVLAKRFFPLIATLFIFILIGNWFGLMPGIGSIYVTEPIVVGAERAHAEEVLPNHTIPGVHDVNATQAEEVHGEEEHHISLFYPVSVDLNFTLALAIIAFFAIEISGIMFLGAGTYASKFFNFSSPINFLVGIIELLSELARLVSFSFRLFGNMFAGKTLILVAMFFVPLALPVPLMFYEVFVGFIQASIFSLLTLFFIKLAIAEPH
jgi:F-type H+-transporting ATPase subunit a